MASRTTPVGTAVAGQQAAAATMNGAAGGWIGEVSTTTSQTGIGTTIVDLTGMSIAVTVGTSRKLLLMGKAVLIARIATVNVKLLIREGATTLDSVVQTCPVNTRASMVIPGVIVSASAGAHTYKLSAVGDSNTLDTEAAAGQLVSLIVIDMGPQ